MLFAALLLTFQTAAPVCIAIDKDLPAPLTAWAIKGDGDPSDMTRPVLLKSLTPEDFAKLESTPPKQVSSIEEVLAEVGPYSPPAQTGGAMRVGFGIETAGTYGITLDQPGWIEVSPVGGTPLASVKHGHGPDCSTIRKIVRFTLEPGRYVLRLTKLIKPQAKVMLVRD